MPTASQTSEVWHLERRDASCIASEAPIGADVPPSALQTCLASGLQAWRTRGGACHWFVRIVAEVACCDPWRWVDAQPESGRRLKWAAPDDQLRAAAAGPMQIETLGETAPLAILDKRLARLKARLVLGTRGRGDPPTEQLRLPLAFFATPFAPQAAHQHNVWGRWHDGACLIPQHMVARDAQHRAFAVWQGDVEPGVAAKTWAQQVVAFLLSVRQLASTSAVVQQREESSVHPGPSVWPALSPTFVARVARAQKEMTQGRLRKVVLAEHRCLKGTPDPEEAASGAEAWFTRLARGADASARFLFPLGDHSFLGATPEVLIRQESGHLWTHAVAGTRAVCAAGPQASVEAELLADPKERHEHGLVVEAICHKLRDQGVTPMPEDRPHVVRFGSLLHLVTPIAVAETTPNLLLRLAQVLHPTPALGGLPSAAALAFLQQDESMSRGLYGSPMGWVAPDGQGVVHVGIRSAWVGPAEAHLFAGVGVVPASRPEQEWQELQRKFWVTQAHFSSSSILR